MPKVSVIMGVYNCKNKDMLQNSIKSILEQSYQDFEFLICNDGSTDDTLEALYELGALDSRIKILTYEKNEGLAFALNYCLKNSVGEYIARQDEDDISEKERFTKQVEFLDHNQEFGVVGTNAFVFDKNGIYGTYDTEEYITKRSFLWNSPIIHPTVMMRKEVLDKCGGYRISKETRRCEDYDLFMRIYAKGYKEYNLQEYLFRYQIEITNKKYRPMKYRIDEAVVRFKGYKQLKMLFKGLPYVFKPILIGLIPQCIFKKIRRKQYQK
jgi:glycosyltransferase involved in cell wall biosynthesis